MHVARYGEQEHRAAMLCLGAPPSKQVKVLTNPEDPPNFIVQVFL